MSTITTMLKTLQNLFIEASDAGVQFNSGDYDSTLSNSKRLLANKKTIKTELLYVIHVYSQNQLGHKKETIASIETGRARFSSSIR